MDSASALLSITEWPRRLCNRALSPAASAFLDDMHRVTRNRSCTSRRDVELPMIPMGAEAGADSGDLVAAVDGLFQFATYGCSRPHAISLRSSVATGAPRRSLNPVSSAMPPDVQFQSEPAVRRENFWRQHGPAHLLAGGFSQPPRACSSLVPIGEPQPVQASQPGPAEKLPLLPLTMSLNRPRPASEPYSSGFRKPTGWPSF